MRFSGDQERDIARAIRKAEWQARSAIAGIDVAEDIVRKRPSRAERTRAGAMERLREAIDAVSESAAADPELRSAAAESRAAWAEAEGLRWQLAMSARHIARGEARKLACSLMSEEDLVQEGHIGLLRAARRFDPDRGIRFTTYARWWVRAQMTRSIESAGRLVRLPGGAVEQLRNLRRARERLDSVGGTYDVQDLAEEVGIEKSRAVQLLSIGGVLSLDQSDDDGLCIADRLTEDDPNSDPMNAAVKRQSLARMKGAFGDLLDERERFILTSHYGLDGSDAQTMADIGKAMGLSRERVRQIEVGALKRLRKAV